jgi:hypothetical protein
MTNSLACMRAAALTSILALAPLAPAVAASEPKGGMRDVGNRGEAGARD